MSKAARRILSVEWKPPEVPCSRATIPITAGQWNAVLLDADLGDLVLALDAATERLIDLRLVDSKRVGGLIKARLSRLLEADRKVREVVQEVTRFLPPDPQLSTARSVASIGMLTVQATTALADLLLGGFESAAEWATVRKAGSERADLCKSLLAGHDELENAVDVVLDRAFGISTAKIAQSQRLTWLSALLSEWSTRQAELDGRVRDQLPHLVEPAGELTNKVRHHVVQLSASSRPLYAHRMAVLARDLVRRALATDPVSCVQIVTSPVLNEAKLESTHRATVTAYRAFVAAEEPDDRMREACKIYHAVTEGYVRAVGPTALRLLGQQLPEKVMLTELSERLASLSEDTVCGLLAGCIRPAWRNSMAHELVSWNPITQMADLDGEFVEIDAIFEEALRAREICQAFETGVAVAMWEAGNPNAGHDVNSEVGLTMSTMMTLGEVGIVVHSYRRAGSTVRLTVPAMTVSSLQWFLIALVRASSHLQNVDRWEIMQEGGERPLLAISAPAIEATIDGGRSNDGVEVLNSGVSSLPMIADSLRAHGAGVAAVVNTVVAIASSQVVGEHQRLRVGRGTQSIVDEWSETAAAAERAVGATLRLVDASGAEMLESYLRVLRRAREAIDVDELKVALRSAAPAQLPWIDKQEQAPKVLT